MGGIDDRIVDVITDGSTYEQLRLRRRLVFAQPIPTKIRYSAGLLAVLALAYPVLYLLPSSGAMPSLGPPARVRPALATVAAIGGLAIGVTGVGLGWIAFRLVSASPLTETQARRLLNLEQLFSWFGFVSGGAALLGTVVLLALGVGGVEMTRPVTGDGVGRPFRPDTGPPMALVSTACGLAAGVFLVASSMAETALS